MMSGSPYISVATSEDFSRVVIENSYRVPVLVDFWADWCAPCRVLMPLLAGLANEFDGKFLLAKVNTEEERELGAQYQIRSLPTVKLFRNGEGVPQDLSQTRRWLRAAVEAGYQPALPQLEALEAELQGARSGGETDG